MSNHKKQTGIWLDYKEAYLITLREGEEHLPEIKHLHSNIEWGVPKGGSRSKTPWGPQGGINEQTFMERRHHEEKTYFDSIIQAIEPDTDELIIFGPAEAKTGLQKAIAAIKHFPVPVKGVHTADSMTLNQIIAQVKDYFSVPV